MNLNWIEILFAGQHIALFDCNVAGRVECCSYGTYLVQVMRLHSLKYSSKGAICAGVLCGQGVIIKYRHWQCITVAATTRHK